MLVFVSEMGLATKLAHTQPGRVASKLTSPAQSKPMLIKQSKTEERGRGSGCRVPRWSAPSWFLFGSHELSVCNRGSKCKPAALSPCQETRWLLEVLLRTRATAEGFSKENLTSGFCPTCRLCEPQKQRDQGTVHRHPSWI